MNFNTIGIICEYNPFHFGHMYHIKEAKRISGADNVVCIMSGSMVQRGEPAIFDKWIRAKCAVQHGADLVIELPAYYALQSAENFAAGSVGIIDATGVVDGICFGAETDNISLLSKAADLVTFSDSQYNLTLSAKLNEGFSYPQSCEYALRKCLPQADDTLFSPNNILGISYISAIKKLNSNMIPLCIKRTNDYHGYSSDDSFISATAIREILRSGGDYSSYAPDYPSANTYFLKNAEVYILGFFRSATPEALADIKGFEPGIANLIINSARQSSSLEEMFDKCVSRRYTLHRIRRFCMCAMLGIKGNLSPEYIRVLGFNKKGASLIRRIKQNSILPIITKTADFEGSAMFDMDIVSTDFASLCSSDPSLRTCGRDYINSPYIHQE